MYIEGCTWIVHLVDRCLGQARSLLEVVHHRKPFDQGWFRCHHGEQSLFKYVWEQLPMITFVLMPNSPFFVLL